MNQSEVFLFSSAGKTHPGRVRNTNQDAFLALPELGVWAVADGVGGHQRGGTASRAVVDAIAALASADKPDNLVESVRGQLLDVNRRLIQIAQQAGPSTIIGSTVAVLVVEDRHCVCLWAGDSRVYGLRQGKLSRLTRDHSQIEDLVDQGHLSPTEAKQHPDANVIYRAIGKSEDLELDAIVYDINVHDKFLLCTDGLTKEISDEEIADVLATGTCRDNCRALVDIALNRNCRDNVAIIVVDVGVRSDRDATVPIARFAAKRPKDG